MILTATEHKRLHSLIATHGARGQSWMGILFLNIKADLAKHDLKELRWIRDFLSYAKKNRKAREWGKATKDAEIRSKVKTTILRLGAVDHSAGATAGQVDVWRMMQKLNVNNEAGLVSGPLGSLLRSSPKALRMSLDTEHKWPGEIYGCGEIWIVGSLHDIQAKIGAAKSFSCVAGKIGRYENYGGVGASAAGGDRDVMLDKQMGDGEAASHDIMATLYTHLYTRAVVEESDKGYEVVAEAGMECVRLVGSKISALAGGALSPAPGSISGGGEIKLFEGPMDVIGYSYDRATGQLPFSQDSLADKVKAAVEKRMDKSGVQGGIFTLVIGSEIHEKSGCAAQKEWGEKIEGGELVTWLQGSNALKGR